MRYEHIIYCKRVNYLADPLDINNNSEERDEIERKSSGVNLVKKNICIIHKARRWDIFFFKEGLKVKEKRRTLKSRLEAFKELKLFLLVLTSNNIFTVSLVLFTL